MNQYKLFWNYMGVKASNKPIVVTAKNLPQALEIAAKQGDLRIQGTTLKTHGNRRIEFWGRHGDGGFGRYQSSPMIEGTIVKTEIE